MLKEILLNSQSPYWVESLILSNNCALVPYSASLSTFHIIPVFFQLTTLLSPAHASPSINFTEKIDTWYLPEYVPIYSSFSLVIVVIVSTFLVVALKTGPSAGFFCLASWFSLSIYSQHSTQRNLLTRRSCCHIALLMNGCRRNSGLFINNLFSFETASSLSVTL